MTAPVPVAGFEPPEALAGVRRWAVVAAVAALVLTAIIVFATGDRRSFYFAYLTTFVFLIGISVGCLGLMMVQFVARGAWGVAIRRLLESGAATLWLMALLFVPILFGLQELFEWARVDEHTADPVVRAKLPYLNTWFFAARAVVIFALWLVFMALLRRWSALEEATGDSRYTQRARNLSGPGIVMCGLTVTVAATDWVMSLDPRWSSSIFGLLVLSGWGLSGMSFVLVVLAWLSQRPPVQQIVTERHLQDLGTLLFALVLLFTYLQYSQFVIVWSGNLPEEAAWYLRRMSGGWQLVGQLLITLHFVAPAALLLSRSVKQRARMLGSIAGVLLLMRLIEAWYLVGPEAADAAEGHSAGAAMPHGAALLLYLLLPIGVSGLWLAFFVRGLMERPLLPAGDPLLARALAHGRSAH